MLSPEANFIIHERDRVVSFQHQQEGEPKEETNLDGIGSDEDNAAREAAAKTEFHWDAAVGGETGLQIWRVENTRTKNDVPDFGIKRMPEEKVRKVSSGRFLHRLIDE